MNYKKVIKKYLIYINGMLRRDTSGKVLYYHDISKEYTSQGTPKEVFMKHIEIIKKEGYKIVTGIPQNNREVMICFDDGWRGIWDHRAYLIKNGIFPTVFLIVDYIGREGYLNLNEILELQMLGFRFQGHTYSHKTVTGLKRDEMIHELIEARVELSRILNKEVKEFCFPRGDYSDQAIEYCLSGGYDKVYTSTPGKLDANGSLITRILVQDSDSVEFKGSLYGGQLILSAHAEKLHHKGK